MLQLATSVATCNIKGGWYRGTVAEEGVVEAYQVKREVSHGPTCLCACLRLPAPACACLRRMLGRQAVGTEEGNNCGRIEPVGIILPRVKPFRPGGRTQALYGQRKIAGLIGGGAD